MHCRHMGFTFAKRGSGNEARAHQRSKGEARKSVTFCFGGIDSSFLAGWETMRSPAGRDYKPH